MTKGNIVLATALALCTSSIFSEGEAAGVSARARFVFDGIANCEQPAVRNFPVHSEGSGVLSTDRTATLEMESNVEGRVRYSGKLGGKPVETPGGSATLRVAGKHTLRATRDYPNNVLVVYMTVIGSSCTLKVENRLKPGKHLYSFYGNNGGVAYCSKPQIVRAECTAY